MNIPKPAGTCRASNSAFTERFNRALSVSACTTDQTREGDQVDCELTEIGVELTGEAQAASDTGHRSRHQVVQITIGGGGQLEGAEADIVQSLVVDDHHLISVLDELVDGQGGVVGLTKRIQNGQAKCETTSPKAPARG